jgi:hypothetical protein
MPLRRLIFLSSLVLAVAALGPAAALGAANGTDRPLSGTITATATDNLSTGTSAVVGTFLFTHLGKGTFHEDATAGPSPGPNRFTYTGTETYVAANGDKLFATVAATGTLTPPANTTVETITGGTGRFAGASGTFTTARAVVVGSVSTVFVPGVGVILTDTFTGTAEGQISY